MLKSSKTRLIAVINEDEGNRRDSTAFIALHVCSIFIPASAEVVRATMERTKASDTKS